MLICSMNNVRSPELTYGEARNEIGCDRSCTTDVSALFFDARC
jgi:hypothetical protein